MLLKINFSDFWKGFDKKSNYFWRLLSESYELQISEQPDLLIFSVYGNEFRKYKCLRIFYTGEFYEPNFSISDLAFSFSYSNDNRNYRLPIYNLYYDIRGLLYKPEPEIIRKSKQKFCCFVVSNAGNADRNNFFFELSKYKRVDSGGRYLNNIGGPVENKTDFIADYKFVICFENDSYPGYSTEKITDAMVMSSIPIYFGDPMIGNDFNVKSFVNVHDYNSVNEAIAEIIRIDNDDELYTAYLREPWLKNNEVNGRFLNVSVLKRMEDLIENRDNLQVAAFNKQSLRDVYVDKQNRKRRGERKFYDDSMKFKIRNLLFRFLKK